MLPPRTSPCAESKHRDLPSSPSLRRGGPGAARGAPRRAQGARTTRPSRRKGLPVLDVSVVFVVIDSFLCCSSILTWLIADCVLWYAMAAGQSLELRFRFLRAAELPGLPLAPSRPRSAGVLQVGILGRAGTFQKGVWGSSPGLRDARATVAQTDRCGFSRCAAASSRPGLCRRCSPSLPKLATWKR